MFRFSIVDVASVKSHPLLMTFTLSIDLEKIANEISNVIGDLQHELVLFAGTDHHTLSLGGSRDLYCTSQNAGIFISEPTSEFMKRQQANRRTFYNATCIWYEKLTVTRPAGTIRMI